jgi:trimethylamine:corrinoid methyltransferase-like protein
MGGHPLLKTSLLENPDAEKWDAKYGSGKGKYDAQSQWRRCLFSHVNTYIDTHIHIIHTYISRRDSRHRSPEI